MAAAPPLTIGEARPNVPRAPIFVGTVFLVSVLFAVGFVTMRTILSSHPDLLARVPWLLPLWSLWGVYLPRTPVAVDKAIMNVGFVAIGAWVLGTMEVVAVALPVENERGVVTCPGVVAAFAVGLLVFWVWLVGKYGGPEADPADAPAV